MKQPIIKRDLEMSPGKISGQATHASVGYALRDGEDLSVTEY